jgi:MGT family glycosyltransferase
MARVLVATWDGAGNLVSTLGISQRLVQDGHDVRLLGHRSIPARSPDHGWRFRPLQHTGEFDSSDSMDLEREMELLGDRLWFSESVAQDVINELELERADVLLSDAMLFGAMSAGEAAGIPTAALFHSSLTAFRGGPLVEMLQPVVPTLHAMRASLGLPAVDAISDVHDGCARSLVAMPREFEMDVPMPPNACFVGPVLDGPTLAGQTDEVDVADGPEPLVVVSFSTSNQGQTPMLQLLADVLGTLPARVVLTTGPSVDPATIEAGANTRVVQFVPHDQLFPHASLVVTHAGLGTVMSALSHGVPMLCVPMGRDQFFNAMRVEALGAGRTVHLGADAAAITGAVQAMLDDSAARDGAKRMANVIAGYGGAGAAVEEIVGLARG